MAGHNSNNHCVVDFALRGRLVRALHDSLALHMLCAAACPLVKRRQRPGFVFQAVCLRGIDLKPGEKRQVTISIDPRLLETFDEGAQKWRIQPGAYRLTAGFDSQQRQLAANFELQSASLPP